MKEKLQQIDEILASYEDWMHGIHGEQCTMARRLLNEVMKSCKLYMSGMDTAGACNNCGKKYGEH